MLQFSLDIDEDGFSVLVDGKPFGFRYPSEVWRSFPYKRELASEFAYVLTYSIPLLAREKRVHFDIPKPQFFEKYNQWFLKESPFLMNRMWGDSASMAKKRMEAVQWSFGKGEAKTISLPKPEENRALLAFSLGSDSLASIVVGQRLGLQMTGVFYRDPLMAVTDNIRFPHFETVRQSRGIETHFVLDGVHRLCDYAIWNHFPSELGAALEIPRYCLMMIPFAYYFKAKYILLGNEYDKNFETVLKDGTRSNVNPMQTVAGTKELDDWMSTLTGGHLRVTSLIHFLPSIAVYKLITQVDPEIGLHLVPCGDASDASGGIRWCHDCEACYDSYLLLTAFGKNPVDYGFTESMFEKSKRKNIALFWGKVDPKDAYRVQEAEQQLLAFLYAHRRGAKGWAMEQFQKKYLEEATRREKELLEKYLRVQKSPNILPLVQEAKELVKKLLAD